MENKRGITLVSLVVTIIVLIILAGVSINLFLGDKGIITIAKKAKENTEFAKIQEETQLNELHKQLMAEGGASNEEKTENGETDIGSKDDTVTLTKEEYNKIIERLDAIDGGNKSSISISDVATDMSTMQENLNSSISDINSNLSKMVKPETLYGAPIFKTKNYVREKYHYSQITEIMQDIAWDLGSTEPGGGLVVCTVKCDSGVVSILYSPNGVNYGTGLVLNYLQIIPFRLQPVSQGTNKIIFGNPIQS